MITLCKSFEFAAAHTLRRPDWSAEKNREVFGKCSNQHGHNYVLEVSVTGKPHPETAMVIEASDLSQLVDELVVREVDHKNLNTDVPWLSGILPTSEALVEAFWQRLDGPIPKAAPHAQLSELRLYETRKIWTIKRR